jgi:hypothetical protein
MSLKNTEKMKPFLQQVAHHYLEAQNLEDYCFVFPNRRGGQFFAHHLQEELVAADKSAGVIRPHLMPRVTSINELVAEQTGTVAASDIEMMFALYDAYCQAMGDKAQEFDKFIYWAHLIVSDFNDIDRSMADAAKIYQNLGDLHDLSSNYLSPEVKEKVRKVFGDDLFTAFFDTDADASLWRIIEKESSDDKDKQGGKSVDGEVKKEFLSLWNRLEDIYGIYHKLLADKDVVSPGRQLRLAAEQQPDVSRYARMVFVGFGVLSVAEVKLFDHFKASGKADFWWDNAGIPALLEQAPHDPGALLIDGYCRRFNAMPLQALPSVNQEIRVVAVPSTVGQAKQAFDEVERMLDDQEEPGIETAIVLPDESLLVPLLHSIHGTDKDNPKGMKLNVTLGYPLRSSGIVSLMHIVARMHHQASKERGVWTYYREDINDILSHPLIKTYFTTEALSLATELARTNRFRVPASEFAPYEFYDLFTPAMDSENPDADQARYIDNLLSFSNLLMEKMQDAARSDQDDEDESIKGGVKVSLQQAFLLEYIDVLNQLKSSLAECAQPIKRSTVFYLIDRLSASAVVPFTGEPLQGLQIMGLLETRSLDFKNVVILSMNERIFPRRRSINSFIPNYMRRAYGMSTIEQQEAIVAFNFYRLLNRASHVTLVYDSSDQKMGTSEPSRYISQLEKVYGREMHYVEMSPNIDTSASIAIQVPASGDGSLQDLYTRDPVNDNGKNLSASAINKYINCPLQFYMHYIQELNDESETGDFMDHGTFGTIIHDTLSDCYGSGLGEHQVTKEDILYVKKNKLAAAVVRNIKKTYLHVPEDEPDTDTRPLQGEAFMLIDTITSYVNFVLDYDIELIEQTGPFTILECEKTHPRQILEIGGQRFNFTYKPDRVDRLADGSVRIVDYKTGSDETTFAPEPGLPDLFDADVAKRRKAILQLFLYSYAYLIENKNKGVTSVMPFIYKLGSMKDSGVISKAKRSQKPGEQYIFRMDSPVAQDFIAQMATTISRLYNNDFTQATDGAKVCNYCRFLDFCRRSPAMGW